MPTLVALFYVPKLNALTEQGCWCICKITFHQDHQLLVLSCVVWCCVLVTGRCVRPWQTLTSTSLLPLHYLHSMLFLFDPSRLTGHCSPPKYPLLISLFVILSRSGRWRHPIGSRSKTGKVAFTIIAYDFVQIVRFTWCNRFLRGTGLSRIF